MKTKIDARIETEIWAKVVEKAQAAGINPESNSAIVVYALTQWASTEPINPTINSPAVSDTLALKSEGLPISKVPNSEPQSCTPQSIATSNLHRIDGGSHKPSQQESLSAEEQAHMCLAMDKLFHQTLNTEAKQKAQLLLVQAREHIKTEAKEERERIETEAKSERARNRQKFSTQRGRSQIDFPHQAFFDFTND